MAAATACDAMPAQSFEEATPFERRSREASRIRDKYPTRVPVICEKAPRSKLPSIDKKKFLVPGTMLISEFNYIIHTHLSQSSSSGDASQTIYLFVGKTSPKTGAMMSEVYDGHKAADGFLYFKYTAENTLGNFK